jgi:hypothetical protein
VKPLSRIVLFFALLAPIGIPPLFSQVAEDTTDGRWVEYQNGEISMEFDQIPVDVALETIRVKTGLHIVLPSAVDSELLSLRLSRLPLELAVRSLLYDIGFRSFALMYDEQGHPDRAVVLGARPTASVGLSPTSNIAPGVTPEEQEALLKALERWSELHPGEREQIEERLKTMPPSETREQLVQVYGQQVLGIKK